MQMLLIGIATCFSTLVGGYCALRLRDNLHLILGFSAGAIIGVVFFDLMPEALALGTKQYDTGLLLGVVAAGFVGYMMLDRFLVSVSKVSDACRGYLGPASLAMHSFLDGIGIGVAYQVSPTVGIVVAIAVLAHDFSDGINTVNLSLVSTSNLRTARAWLLADALAPLIGIGVTMFVRVPEHDLSVMLATFSGFFLYIGASELIPESYHRHPRLWTSIATIVGVLVICTVVHLAAM